jgi:3-hydroxybutyrate dehydrogenase
MHIDDVRKELALVSFDVSGKTVLVVGGSSGIGYAVAREFAEAGALVAVSAEVETVTEAAASLTAETGTPVRGFKCDITSPDEIEQMIAAVGPLDVLVNNAGIYPQTPIADPSLNHLWLKTMDINVTGLWRVTQAALDNMGEGGRIIFTGSILGKTSGPAFNSAYTASKHAVLGLTRALAFELGARGITVNAVCPGSTETQRMMEDWIDHLPPGAKESLTADMKIHPGLMDPSHVAGAYIFLASPAASEITGQALNVDRGQVMV